MVLKGSYSSGVALSIHPSIQHPPTDRLFYASCWTGCRGLTDDCDMILVFEEHTVSGEKKQNIRAIMGFRLYGA